MQKLLIRHTVDVMHVERNICAILLEFLFGVVDTDRVREDMRRMGIMRDLWIEDREEGVRKPPAPYVLSVENQRKVRNIISSLKFPKGYGANLQLPFTHANFVGLKSHDYHILLQEILPMALRGCLRDDVFNVICHLSRFFKSICTHAVQVNTIQDLELEGFLLLCDMESIFPPSFFNISAHLIAHLVEELYLCGVVHYRWMHPSERYMRHLKLNINSRSRPESNIVENSIIQEVVSIQRRRFHMHEWETMNYDSPKEILKGHGSPITLDPEVRLAAHEYVLQHVLEMEMWRRYCT
jgi:hypothetical protein